MVAVNTHLCFYLSNLKIITPEKQSADAFLPIQAFKGTCYSVRSGYYGHQHARSANKAIQVVLSGIGEIEVSSSSSEEFTFSTFPNKDGKVKVNGQPHPTLSVERSFHNISCVAVSLSRELNLVTLVTVEVSGTKTQEIYDEVFSKMVSDAQPIRGFRRAKGGKTPNIPEKFLLEILGPSNVYEQVIRKVINSATAQYVSKEGLNIGKDLQIVQSLEDLEAGFTPGGKFRFDAIFQLQDISSE